MDPRSRASATIEIRLRTTVWSSESSAEDEEGGGEKQVSTEEEFVCFYFRVELLIGLDYSSGVSLEGKGDFVSGVGCVFSLDWVTTYWKSCWKTFLCLRVSGG